MYSNISDNILNLIKEFLLLLFIKKTKVCKFNQK